MHLARVLPSRFPRLRPFFRRDNHPSNKSPYVVVKRIGEEPIAEVAKEYLSFSIDISVLAGGYWWEGSQGVFKGLGTIRVAPLNLDSRRLDTLVTALGPAYLRVGGSEADKIHYFSRQDGEDEAGLVLEKQTWDELHAFIRRNQLKFMFTFKYGLFKRSEHGNWQGSEVRALLHYSREKNYRLDVCELGNELNAYWAFHGLASQPRAASLAKDYSTFSQLIRANFPNAKICGPGSAFWPRLGETIKPFSNITQKFLQNLRTQLDIVDWHYYPFQSKRSPVRTRTASLKSVLAPSSFHAFAKYCERLRSWRDQYQPDAELWTGETGSAQCGGQVKISDRFASCFWWADQLGQGAVHGQKVMVRQSLIGGEYGLIHRTTLKPRPDYWVSWLWGQLMGEQVYAVKSADPDLLVYCHSNSSGRGQTLLLINTAEEQKTVESSGWGEAQNRYCLSATRVDAKKVLINGVKPKLKRGELSLADFPIWQNGDVLPERSISFWCFGAL